MVISADAFERGREKADAVTASRRRVAKVPIIAFGGHGELEDGKAVVPKMSMGYFVIERLTTALNDPRQSGLHL